MSTQPAEAQAPVAVEGVLRRMPNCTKGAELPAETKITRAAAGEAREIEALLDQRG